MSKRSMLIGYAMLSLVAGCASSGAKAATGTAPNAAAASGSTPARCAMEDCEGMAMKHGAADGVATEMKPGGPGGAGMTCCGKMGMMHGGPGAMMGDAAAGAGSRSNNCPMMAQHVEAPPASASTPVPK